MQGLRRSDARRLVFIDESGAQTNMTRHRGRGRRGQRVRDHAPHGHGQTTTMIGSIRLEGTVGCMAIEGSADREVFRAYVKHILGPRLRQGDGVVVDNLSVHKDAASREMIEALGAHLMFLPPYRPDFNPIEKMWSKVKNDLRSAKARTHPRLIAAIGEALSTITASDAEGYFFSCGYTTSQS
jgi:transposase